MPRLEYTTINDFTKFNFLGKRLFDFINARVSISTGVYTGNGINNREIITDLKARIIMIFSEADDWPVIWLDVFDPQTISKRLDGISLVDGILGVTPRKEAFVIGTSPLVNDIDTDFYYIVIGE